MDLIFPQPVTIETIEKMDMRTFFVRTKAPRNIPHPAIYACRAYRDPLVRKAILEMKYKKNQLLINLFAELLYLYIKNLGISSAYIVPIPAHASRIAEYGFNQTELLAHAIQKLSDNSCTVIPLLTYASEQGIQKNKEKSDRLKVTKDIFKVITPEKLRGRTVIVLDDVATSGATCLAAMQALRAAGVSQIISLVIAH